MNTKKIQSLFVDEKEVGEEILYEAISPFIRFGKESNSVIFTPEYYELGNREKVLVYLLALKAAGFLGLTSVGESASPKAISAATGVTYNSIKPILSGLAKNGLLAREGGRYSVPNHNILRIKEMMS